MSRRRSRERGHARSSEAIVWLGVCSLLASAVVLPLSSAARQTEDVSGLWYVEGGHAGVEIERCENAYCGTITWLRQPHDVYGCALKDTSNPDPSLRVRKVVGLPILSGFRRGQSNGFRLEGGTIYDPESGKTYRGTITLVEPNRLLVRGYVGIPLFGRTTEWTRALPAPRACE